LLRAQPLQQKQKIDQLRKKILQCFKDLHLSVPLYYLSASYEVLQPEHFFRPPNPGMIAWLQYRHRIDLNHSLFITDSDSMQGTNLAMMAGVTTCSAANFFGLTGWSLMSKEEILTRQPR